MENTVDLIKKKLDIVEFVGSFIQLKKAGRNFKAVCPFHQEKTPSFVVSPERQIWHCFGSCGEGGDIIKFLMKWENITFPEALKELALKTGVKLTHLSIEDVAWKRKERLLSLNLLASDFFQYVLNKTSYGKSAFKYLKDRGLSEKIIHKFQLGYAPASWNSLLKFMRKKGYSTQEILDVGLVIGDLKGNYYDRFRGRIVFPLCDPRGNVVGFSGRVLDGSEQGAKYVNTPETVLYHKRETLYGLHIAKEAIKKEGEVILVEGEFDMIAPFQSGVENIVAIKGSAVTSEQLTLLKRYTNKIILMLDTDAAGGEAMKRGINEAENFDFDMGVVELNDVKDPDEAVRRDQIKFKKQVKKPIPVYDFIIDIAKKKYSENDPYSKKKIGEEVLPYIAKIKNSIVRSHYIKKIASILQVSEDSIENALRKFIQTRSIKDSIVVDSQKIIQSIPRELLLQKYLLSVLFQNENPYEVSKMIFDQIEPDDLTSRPYIKLMKILKEVEMSGKKFSIDMYISRLTPELAAVFDELFLFSSAQMIFIQEDIFKIIYEYKKILIKRKLAELLSGESDKNNDENVKRLNEQLNQVEKKLTSL